MLTDPETEVGASPLADVPCLSELPRLIRRKYLTRVNRWTLLDRPPVALLRFATGGRPEESLVWRELLAAYDVSDVASIVFRDRFGCWAFLDLWRIGSNRGFDQPEAEFLVEISDVITAALRHCQANTFVPIAPLPRRSGPVVLVLSPDLEVRAQTAETQEYLRLLDSGGDADIAVTIERTSPAERLDMFARTNGLTRRETELLEHLAIGADTQAIAAGMFISEHTVQDHLKSIFAKTGTPEPPRPAGSGHGAVNNSVAARAYGDLDLGQGARVDAALDTPSLCRRATLPHLQQQLGATGIQPPVEPTEIGTPMAGDDRTERRSSANRSPNSSTSDGPHEHLPTGADPVGCSTRHAFEGFGG